MTNQEIIKYYTDLLIVQYRHRVRARAHVEAVVTPFVMDQLPLDVRDAYNIETAVGVQLDTLAKYANVSRVVRTFSGNKELTDDDLRLLLKLVLVAQRSGSALADIQSLIKTFLPGVLSVFDNKNMQLDYYFNSELGTQELAEAFYLMGLLPKPMGVQLAALIYLPNITGLFGWRTYTLAGQNVNGFNNYITYDTTWTWLSYSNAIGV